MIDFITNNMGWLIGIAVIAIMALIGYLSDKSANKEPQKSVITHKEYNGISKTPQKNIANQEIYPEKSVETKIEIVENKNEPQKIDSKVDSNEQTEEYDIFDSQMLNDFTSNKGQHVNDVVTKDNETDTQIVSKKNIESSDEQKREPLIEEKNQENIEESSEKKTETNYINNINEFSNTLDDFTKNFVETSNVNLEKNEISNQDIPQDLLAPIDYMQEIKIESENNGLPTELLSPLETKSDEIPQEPITTSDLKQEEETNLNQSEPNKLNGTPDLDVVSELENKEETTETNEEKNLEIETETRASTTPDINAEETNEQNNNSNEEDVWKF